MKKTYILLAATATLGLTLIAANAGAGLPRLSGNASPSSADDTHAAPTGLKLEQLKDRTITLSWHSPEPVNGLWDDFESHPDFAFNSPGTIGWQYLDGDNCQTVTWNAGTFPGQGGKMAFMVMNGFEMSLVDGLDMASNPNFQPTSGRKMLVDFCAINGANNDYIISPELHFDEPFQISFQARSYTLSDGAERVRVGYSTTGTRQSDFTFLTSRPTSDGALSPRPGRDYLELPAAWTLVQYEVPAEARYVCVNCVSDDAFIFMLDDLFVGTNNIRPERVTTAYAPERVSSAHAPERQKLTGFNIYRDGQRLNDEPYTSLVFVDQAPAYGVYDYTVTALYADGEESAPSEALTVDCRDITCLPFEDTFSAWYLNYDNWSTPADQQGNESRWTAGYYEYGLVNPSAVYSYSTLRNYDQSLVSRSMRTLEPGNTWLRFTVQHVCYKFEGVDYLDAEVKAQDQTTWHKVATLTNEDGSFPRTVYQYDISRYVRDAHEGRFQIRFRAHGADAQYIDYWYVDDVKVWNPVWGKAELTVTDGAQPLPGIHVTLTGDNGGSYEAMTDAMGHISLQQIETGTYTIETVAEGYNAHTTTLVVGLVTPAAGEIVLTYPDFALSTATVAFADMATESSATATFELSNHGTGPGHWSLSQLLPQGQGTTAHRFDLGPTFTLSGDLQSSIVFDGEHYYTSSWYFLGTFYKYDREGRFLEQFSIPGMYYMVYDFAYDGRYVYASDYSNRIFQLDLDERRIVSIIEASALPDLKITHLAYDPDRDAFWCGTFGTLVLIDRDGDQQAMEMPWECAAYGSAYDNVSPGGPYLWVTDMTMPDDVIIDKIMLRQYSLNSRSFTGVNHIVNDMPGYINGSATVGQNQVCGVTITDQLIPGQMTLVGVLQQSPSLVWTYNVCDLNPWLDVTPRRGTLAAGESQTVSVSVNSLRAAVGQTCAASFAVESNPARGTDLPLQVTMQVTHATATPRPQQLTVTAGNAQAVLAWQGTAPSYDILRDGEVIASCSATTYTDLGLVSGTYKYNVRAHYPEGDSQLSDEVSVLIRQGAQFYAPLDLAATITRNHAVHLSWQSPLAHVGEDFTLMWGTGENADQLGIGSGYLYAGQRWLADELIAYRNKTITSVNVRICAPVTYLAARIYQDGKLVARTVHSGTVRYGEYNTIRLTRPVSVVPGSDYIIAVQVQAAEGIRPLGMDASNDFDGRGNLISLDGTTWYTASQTAIEGNFNLSFTCEGAEAELAEPAPAAYCIYRDGQLIAETADTAFDDVAEAPGLHHYAVASRYDGQPHGLSPLSQEATVRVLDLCNRQAPARTMASVERNRIVHFSWEPAPSATIADARVTFPVDLSAPRHTQRAGYPALLRTWQAAGSEMGVACDGQYVYTSIFNESGRINVYDLLGNPLGKVVIRDMNLGGIRNLAWDGKSLWAADASAKIHRLAIDVRPSAAGYEITGQLVQSYSISEYSRHLAYIPDLNDGQGGFETGDWNTSIIVSHSGAKQGNGPTYHAASGTAYYDGHIYAFEQGNPASSHCVAVYDLASRQQERVIDLGQYVELTDIDQTSAGGASTFQTADGMTILLLCLQSGSQPSRVLFLDLSGSEGVTGYNVYRDGQLLAEDQAFRSFTDTLSTVGDYEYQVSTRYLDGSESVRSAVTPVTIVDHGTIDAPVSVQAQPSFYPYNVSLSFAPAHFLEGYALAEDFEQGQVGQPLAADALTNLGGQWILTTKHYHGAQAIMADATSEAWLIIPVRGCRSMGFTARCEVADEQLAQGSLEIYYSLDGDHVDDFIRLDSYAVLPDWQDYGVALPNGTEYVIVRKPAESRITTLLDALRLSSADEIHDEAPLYQVFRDGHLLTPEPIASIAYTDHNLPQGLHTYQVRAISPLSAMSALSEPAVIDLRYDNGGQAPVNVRADVREDGSGVELTWDAPALGADRSLAWHNGHNADAAGLGNGGAYYAAVRWTPGDLVGLDALSISEVEVYVNQVPSAMYVLLYEGTELLRQQYVERPQQYAFNRIALQEPLPLNTQKELRLVVYVEHNEITVPLGYDEGPCRAPGKSDMYSSDGVNWTRLGDDNTGINANWNFGVILRPYALAQAEARSRARCRQSVVSASTESSLNALLGYRVYVNRIAQHEGELSATSWLDSEVRPGIPYLEYQVKAVYTQSGEVSSPVLRIQNPMQTAHPEQGREMTDGIDELTHDADATLRYNLQGQLIHGQQSGITVAREAIELR